MLIDARIEEIHHEHPALIHVRAHQAEELDGSEVERNVGPALVEVNLYDIVAVRAAGEPRACIRQTDVQPARPGGKPKEAHAGLDYLWINLHRVDLYVSGCRTHRVDGPAR